MHYDSSATQWRIKLTPGPIQQCGMWYFKISLHDNEALDDSYAARIVVSYCFMLPLQSVDSIIEEESRNYYSVITNDWREIGQSQALEYCRGLCHYDLVTKTM